MRRLVAGHPALLELRAPLFDHPVGRRLVDADRVAADGARTPWGSETLSASAGLSRGAPSGTCEASRFPLVGRRQGGEHGFDLVLNPVKQGSELRLVSVARG
jgi:hypothetical protein